MFLFFTVRGSDPEFEMLRYGSGFPVGPGSVLSLDTHIHANPLFSFSFIDDMIE